MPYLNHTVIRLIKRKKIFTLILLLFFSSLYSISISAQAPKGIELGDSDSQTKKSQGTGKKYALVIGVSSYKDQKLGKLKFAHTDAANFKKFIEEGYLGKFEEVKLLLENDATYPSFVEAVSMWLTDLIPLVTSQDEIYIYFSGHGMVSERGQNLLPIDTKIIDNNLASLHRSYPLSSIRDVFKDIVSKKNPPRVFYIIDACRENEDLVKGVLTSGKLSESIIEQGEYFLYASAEDQFSYETDLINPGTGIFTYFLINGLKGAADTDNDNNVSLEEIQSFVTKNVTRFAEKRLKKTGTFRQIPSINFKNKTDGYDVFLTSELNKDTVARYKKIVEQTMARIRTGDESYYLASRGVSGLSSIPSEPAINESIPFRNSLTEDTSGSVLYADFLKAVSLKKLLEPAGESAYDIYQQLEKEESKKEIVKSAGSKLFSALVAKCQDLIDAYLEGTLKNTEKQTFDLAFRELTVAKTLITPNNPYSNILIPKIDFLHARALAGSFNPKDWDTGEKIIESVINSDPHAAHAYYTKGILFSSKHRFTSAVKNFNKAVEYAPGWTFAMYNLAEAYFHLSEFAKSIQICRNILIKDPFYADASVLIARNFFEVKMYDSAISYCKTALSINPLNVSARVLIGNSHLRIDPNGSNLQSAFEMFHEASIIYKDPEASVVLGTAFFKRNQSDSAQHYYTAALTTNVFYIPAIESLARLFVKNGDVKKADSIFQDAIIRMGDDSRINFAYINFLQDNDRWNEAEIRFRKLIQTNHEDPSFFIQYSKRISANGQLTAALNTLHQGLLFIPNSPSLVYNLAELYFKNYQNPIIASSGLDSSLFYFKKSRTISPNHSFTHFGLYQVFLLMGNLDSAFSSLDKARRNNKYIETITNYNPDLILIANKALSEKKYDLALTFYQQVKEKNNEFEINRKIGLVLLLSGKPEMALRFAADTLKTMRSTRSQEIAGLQLQAHCLFELKKYKEAAFIFKQIDDMSPLPNYLEYALCKFMLDEPEEANIFWNKKPDSRKLIYDTFLQNECIRYTTFFINSLKKLTP